MDRSPIEWLAGDGGKPGASWNPIRGCSRVSQGCVNCYAEAMAARFSKPGLPYAGFVHETKHGGRWTGEVGFVPKLLDWPLRRRRARRIFVNSMADLFHEKVDPAWLDQIFAVMAYARHHTFVVLTKRPERMRWYLEQAPERVERWVLDRLAVLRQTTDLPKLGPLDLQVWNQGTIAVHSHHAWPLPNVILGISAENQETADERIPILLETPAAYRMVSAEPLLGPLDLNRALRSDPHGRSAIGLDWVVVGGETSPGARPFDVRWALDLIAQCRAAGVTVFVKQLGAKPIDGRFLQVDGKPGIYPLTDKKGANPQEWPAELRVREFPEMAV